MNIKVVTLSLSGKNLNPSQIYFLMALKQKKNFQIKPQQLSILNMHMLRQ